MKKVLVTGGRNSGKSHLMLYTSRIVSNMGKKVLAIDATESKGSYYFFNINERLDELCKNGNSKLLMCEDIDLIFSRRGEESNEIQNTINLISGNYEYVFIEVDKIPEFEHPEDIEEIIVLQDCDKKTLIQNAQIIKETRETFPKAKLRLFINRYISCKLKPNYIEYELNMKIDENLSTPLEQRDEIKGYNNKMDGRLNISNFGEFHNKALFYLACGITGVENNKTNYRKYVK